MVQEFNLLGRRPAQPASSAAFCLSDLFGAGYRFRRRDGFMQGRQWIARLVTVTYSKARRKFILHPFQFLPDSTSRIVPVRVSKGGEVIVGC